MAGGLGGALGLLLEGAVDIVSEIYNGFITVSGVSLYCSGYPNRRNRRSGGFSPSSWKLRTRFILSPRHTTMTSFVNHDCAYKDNARLCI